MYVQQTLALKELQKRLYLNHINKHTYTYDIRIRIRRRIHAHNHHKTKGIPYVKRTLAQKELMKERLNLDRRNLSACPLLEVAWQWHLYFAICSFSWTFVLCVVSCVCVHVSRYHVV